MPAKAPNGSGRVGERGGHLLADVEQLAGAQVLGVHIHDSVRVDVEGVRASTGHHVNIVASIREPESLAVARIVGRGGALGGYRWGLERKKRLLEKERAMREKQTS